MLKLFTLILAFSATSILSLSKAALSSPIPVDSQYSVATNSDKNMPVCYVQTVEGKTLNLSYLCRKKLPSPQSKVLISQVVQNGDRLIGRVVNNTGKPVSHAKVNFEIIGKDGRRIEKGSISMKQQTLNPGQAGTFQSFMPPGLKVRTTSVTWDE